jgi:hypothetical protein
MESAQTNGHMDRALAAEARAAELEERLRAYEQHGTNGYANAPPATEEQQPLEQIPEQAPSPREQAPQQHPPPDDERQRRQQEHQRRFLELVDKRADADELIKRFTNIPVSPELEQTLSRAVLDSPNSVELAMHLLENPNVMEKIARLSPDQAQWELARLSGRLEASNGQSRPWLSRRPRRPFPPFRAIP